MAQHLMVVLSNVKDGREDEFNAWYDGHMLDTINKLEGWASGQRFERAELDGAPFSPYRYLAVYEVDGDDLDTAFEQFKWQRQERAEAEAAGRDPVVSVSDSLDPEYFLVGFFSAVTDRTPSTRKGQSS